MYSYQFVVRIVMKICFFLQRRFAYVGHTLMCNLNKEFGVRDFCAYVMLRANHTFLRSQKDITYGTLLLDEDIHNSFRAETLDPSYLAWLEKEYGIPNLWPYLMVDRILISTQLVREYPYDKPMLSHTDMLRVLQATAKKIISFLETEKPDGVVFGVVSSLGSMLLYEIAKKKGIKTLVIDFTKIGGGVLLTENYKEFTGVKKIFKATMSGKRAPQKLGEAEEFLKKFRVERFSYNEEFAPAASSVNRETQFAFLKVKKLLPSLFWHLKHSTEYLRKKERDYDDIQPHFMMWDKCKRKLRVLRGYDDLYAAPEQGEPFALYPLHLDPEIATLLLGPHHTDQIHVIKQMARSLPVGHKLYVKEHPSMVGYRTRRYYKEITKIPNVKLINPNVSGIELVKTAQLVFTISGTVGWEAVLTGKPVITFGDVGYNILSFIRHSDSYEKLPYLVKEQLEQFTYDEQELLHFLNALLEDSVTLNLHDAWLNGRPIEELKKDVGLQSLAELIAKKLSLKPLPKQS